MVNQATSPYQLLPLMAADEYEALKADIAARGVQVPIELDEAGHVLDGHHRLRACEELGISEYPRAVRSGLTEQQKTEHVLALNLARRHLSADQQRALWARLQRDHRWSIRQIAEKTGTPKSTVADGLREARTQVSEVGHLPDAVTGRDGKTYPSQRQEKSTKTPEFSFAGLPLEEIEARIAPRMDQYRVFVEALLIIRDRRLYVDAGFSSFTGYLRRRLGDSGALQFMELWGDFERGEYGGMAPENVTSHQSASELPE